MLSQTCYDAFEVCSGHHNVIVHRDSTARVALVKKRQGAADSSRRASRME